MIPGYNPIVERPIDEWYNLPSYGLKPIANERYHFCDDCWTGYLDSHICANPRPHDLSMLPYYDGRRSYLANKTQDRWGDNAPNDPEQAGQ